MSEQDGSIMIKVTESGGGVGGYVRLMTVAGTTFTP